MMTMKEAEALPIPEEYKNTPNIYRLARIINSSKHRREIMHMLPLILPNRNAQADKRGGEEA